MAIDSAGEGRGDDVVKRPARFILTCLAMLAMVGCAQQPASQDVSLELERPTAVTASNYLRDKGYSLVSYDGHYDYTLDIKHLTRLPADYSWKLQRLEPSEYLGKLIDHESFIVENHPLDSWRSQHAKTPGQTRVTVWLVDGHIIGGISQPVAEWDTLNYGVFLWSLEGKNLREVHPDYLYRPAFYDHWLNKCINQRTEVPRENPSQFVVCRTLLRQALEAKWRCLIAGDDAILETWYSRESAVLRQTEQIRVLRDWLLPRLQQGQQYLSYDIDVELRSILKNEPNCLRLLATETVTLYYASMAEPLNVHAVEVVRNHDLTLIREDGRWVIAADIYRDDIGEEPTDVNATLAQLRETLFALQEQGFPGAAGESQEGPAGMTDFPEVVLHLEPGSDWNAERVGRKLLEFYLLAFTAENVDPVYRLKDYAVGGILDLHDIEPWGFRLRIGCAVQPFLNLEEDSPWLKMGRQLEENGWIIDIEMVVTVVKEGSAYTLRTHPSEET